MKQSFDPMIVRAERGNAVTLPEAPEAPAQAAEYRPRLSPAEEQMQRDAISEKYRKRSEALMLNQKAVEPVDSSLQGYRKRSR